jgi:hypothetical protein
MTQTVGESPLPLRIDLDADDVGQGFAQVVLLVLEILRELLERQAVRRLSNDELSPEQVERLGAALRDIAETLDDLRTVVSQRRNR